MKGFPVSPEVGVTRASWLARAHRRVLRESGPSRGSIGRDYAASKAGTGNAVTDLIFSMAKRDVTFFSATVPTSFL